MSRLEFLVWRHIPVGSHPLHFGWILKARGRWNRAGQYGALYTSLSREGAMAELRKYREVATASDVAVKFQKRHLVSIRVEVEPVLDLTDPSTIRILKTDASAFLEDDDGSLAACRTISDFARSQEYRALIAPSAALPGAKNLIIFSDGPSHGLSLEVGPDREEV